MHIVPDCLLLHKREWIAMATNGQNDEQLEAALEMMEAVMEDTSVPKNIRAAISEAKDKIANCEEMGVGVTSALYLLEDISNDINMPAHTRTEIWNIISELESIREKNK